MTERDIYTTTPDRVSDRRLKSGKGESPAEKWLSLLCVAFPPQFNFRPLQFELLPRAASTDAAIIVTIIAGPLAGKVNEHFSRKHRLHYSCLVNNLYNLLYFNIEYNRNIKRSLIFFLEVGTANIENVIICYWESNKYRGH